MNQSLSDLIREKRQRATGDGGIDWDDRRNRYLSAVENLYGQIRAILAAPIEQGHVSFQRRPKTLSELHIGTYSVDDLILLIGDEQVRFSPRGRNIVGSSGRVDVLGRRGDGTLVVQPGPRWGVVTSRQPTLRIEALDETSFAELLRNVMSA